MSQPSGTAVKMALYRTPPDQSRFGIKAMLSSTSYFTGVSRADVSEGGERRLQPRVSGLKWMMVEKSCRIGRAAEGCTEGARGELEV